MDLPIIIMLIASVICALMALYKIWKLKKEGHEFLQSSKIISAIHLVFMILWFIGFYFMRYW